MKGTIIVLEIWHFARRLHSGPFADGDEVAAVIIDRPIPNVKIDADISLFPATSYAPAIMTSSQYRSISSLQLGMKPAIARVSNG
jgi:hypothetical protein